MRETKDKEIFTYFGISKKTWYNYKDPVNPKHRLYLAMLSYWNNLPEKDKAKA